MRVIIVDSGLMCNANDSCRDKNREFDEKQRGREFELFSDFKLYYNYHVILVSMLYILTLP